jgi:putative solute:sodium symporter small subunit
MRRASDDGRRVFWSRTRQLTWWLLGAWLLVSLAAPWFARDLDRFHAFGFPVGHWLAAQGALLLFLAIVVVDVVVMERIETRYLESEDAAGGAGGADEPESA